MSVTWFRRRSALGLFLLGTAIVAACDATPTQPEPDLARVQHKAAIEGDTTACTRGWVVIAGWYVCNGDS